MTVQLLNTTLGYLSQLNDIMYLSIQEDTSRYKRTRNFLIISCHDTMTCANWTYRILFKCTTFYRLDWLCFHDKLTSWCAYKWEFSTSTSSFWRGFWAASRPCKSREHLWTWKLAGKSPWSVEARRRAFLFEGFPSLISSASRSPFMSRSLPLVSWFMIFKIQACALLFVSLSIIAACACAEELCDTESICLCWRDWNWED